MYRQLIATAPRRAELQEYEDRALEPHEVRVRVTAASPKHGSELADFRGQSPFIDENYDLAWQAFMPRGAEEARGVAFGSWNLGNMWVGRIEETGSQVTEYAVGDRVCHYGGIRETHIVNAVGNHRLRKLPEGVPWQNAVCYDPAQFALGGLRDGNVRAGDYVAVIGLGAIGQIAVQLAKRAGAGVVIAVDPIAVRREIARRSGADAVLDPGAEDVGLAFKSLTGRLGVDVIIETSGSASALQASLRGLAYGGIVSYVAWAKAFPAGLDLGREAHYNYGRLVFSRACSEPNPEYPRWNRRRIEDTCWKLLTDGTLDCAPIISPVVPFEESAAAYCHYVDQHPEQSIKLGILMEEAQP